MTRTESVYLQTEKSWMTIFWYTKYPNTIHKTTKNKRTWKSKVETKIVDDPYAFVESCRARGWVHA